MSVLLLLASTFALSCSSYLVWPSRWNIPAHLAAGLWFVAYLVPAAIVGVQKDYLPVVQGVFMKSVVIGALCYVVGTVLGAACVRRIPMWLDRAVSSHPGASEVRPASKRVYQACLLGVGLLVASIAIMGFVPLIASDPLAAKFFRGQYAASYNSVRIPYRLGTELVIVSLPLILYFWWKNKARLSGGFILAAAGVVLLGTLQRSALAVPIVAMACLGLAAARRKISMWLVVIGSYIVGGLYYEFVPGLGAVGLNHPTNIWQSIAGTAPDLRDNFGFIQQWMINGMPSPGAWPLVGGLIPGNFQLSPAIWSITVGNPGVQVADVNSGGLRMLGPLWGLVGYGTLGIIIFCLGFGVVAGIVAAVGRRAMSNPEATIFGRVLVLTTLLPITAAITVPGQLTYLRAIGVAISIGLVYGYGRRCTVQARCSHPETASSVGSASHQTGRGGSP